MSLMEQYESSEKYGEEDVSSEREPNCLRSSIHTSRCTPITNSDLETHDSSVQFEHNLITKRDNS